LYQLKNRSQINNNNKKAEETTDKGPSRRNWGYKYPQEQPKKHSDIALSLTKEMEMVITSLI
jgi:hypothetical protein